ncbi:MAG: tryptophan--tRNA ligase [Acidobacteriia bacterium]|nr:tryptophan--tRNA ligase [Terriglobia bacterium]
MRPTGRLHIGHYFGALQNWVKLQEDPSYDSFHFIADWHALTTDYADTSAIAENTIQITIDFLAAGLDPEKSVIFLQSLVPEHAELHLLLSMVTPLGWLERVPTYKEALENIKDKDLHNYGFLGYPVLQCADIVIYSEEGTPLFVPVGEDQVSHVELSREIVRRFDVFYGLGVRPEIFELRNRASLGRCLGGWVSYGAGVDINTLVGDYWNSHFLGRLRRAAADEGIQNFLARIGADAVFFERLHVLSEPEAMLTQTPRIPGTDGRKMSKSYGNFISLSESDESIRAKTKTMMTDPARKRRTDVGDPEKCPAYDWHKLFSPPDTLAWAAEGCRTAGIGCIECKAKMADHLIRWIEPVRARRQEYEKHPGRVLEIVDAGSKKARKVAQETMARVREAVFGWEKKRAEVGK